MLREKWKREANSISGRFMIYAIVFIVPIIIFMVSSNTYAIYLVRKQVYESNKNTLRLYMNQMDRTLQQIEDYLVGLEVQEVNLNKIGTKEKGLDKQLAYYRLNQKFTSDLRQNYNMLNGLFAYSGVDQKSVIVHNTVEDYEQQMELEGYLEKIFQENGNNEARMQNSWYMEEIGTESYLFRIYEQENVYWGAWIGVERGLNNLFTVEITGLDNLVVSDKKGNAFTSRDKITDDIKLDGDMTNYYLTGRNEKYLIVGEDSQKGNIRLLAIIQDRNIVEGLDIFTVLIAILVIASIGLGGLFLIFSKREVARPLKKIADAMKKVENGELDVKVDIQNPKEEISVVNGAFHSMVAQIRQLKIDVYEEKIQKQKLQLEFLQIQIKPHFFLNAMDVVYNYARLQKIDMVKEMTLSLVEHFRYTLYGESMVTLGAELEFIRNYLHMQELHSNNYISMKMRIEMPEEMKEMQIPILLIQPFVENAIKNRSFLERNIEVGISAYLEFEENETYMVAIITDTGEGFEPDILEKLNNGEQIIKEGKKRIGIANVRSRLQLLYGDDAGVKFYNNQPKGAVVKIRFPVKRKTGDLEW